RAAKGVKTDWMMHEFRLPSLIDSSSSPKKYVDKTIPANIRWSVLTSSGFSSFPITVVGDRTVIIPTNDWNLGQSAGYSRKQMLQLKEHSLTHGSHLYLKHPPPIF
ncbi:protein FEZ-like, partial [Trifolium medium]|nr:protein FEZ-like [Trifolium medium]